MFVVDQDESQNQKLQNYRKKMNRICESFLTH